ncbi:MAG TPA: 23S rRNA (pseudouridine(1915)-N(3))-methyltransferase RlmH [Acidisarcina sp.]
MKILIASVASRSRNSSRKPARNSPCDALVSLYLDRIAAYAPVESLTFSTEDALFLHVEKLRARTSPSVVLLDSRGKLLNSEDFAAWLARLKDSGRQQLVLAIGPASGWTGARRAQAETLLSFSPMTLPHELMKVVLAEQVYRAFTILTGHPYHSGH